MELAPTPVSIIAPSSVVPQVELSMGIQRLRFAGLSPYVHPQCSAEQFVFAGTDQQRAAALFDVARDPQYPILWAARGGYGATRLLPLLDQLTQQHGPPPPGKLYVGYSDSTALHPFFRQHWAWHTLHAPMPAATHFLTISDEELSQTTDLLRKRLPRGGWLSQPLMYLANPPAVPLRGALTGGNLSLWAALAGTPYQPSAAGHILFFEDVDEQPYRIDRMVTQLGQAGAFDDAAAIVLGDFTSCDDRPNQVLAAPPADMAQLAAAPRNPLRRKYSIEESLREIFVPIAHRFKIPLATGLPVGHGPHFSPLPLGGEYELTPAGGMSLCSWDWLDPAT